MLQITQIETGRKTEILVGSGIVKRERERIRKSAKKLAVITDSRVEKLFRPTLEALNLPLTFLSFRAGEKYKTRQTKEKLEDALLKNHFGRDGAIIGLGGGVACDVAGFVAATYLRGVPLLLIPTTLLAMVDSSIGGKTAVNTQFGKNSIGAFYPPSLVLIDLDFLRSLPQSERRNGMAEVIKYGLILDPTLLDESDVTRIIDKSLQAKKAIVEGDFKEEGLRRILNFGHTIGHAIELLEEYKIGHGDAVAMGMLFESLMSLEMGHLKEEEVSLIFKRLKEENFPLKFSSRITLKTLERAIHSDKKSLEGVPQFVLMNEIGEVDACRGKYMAPVEKEILAKAFERYAHLTS